MPTGVWIRRFTWVCTKRDGERRIAVEDELECKIGFLIGIPYGTARTCITGLYYTGAGTIIQPRVANTVRDQMETL